jgi:Ankyrin repeats (3 copies)
VLHIASQQGYLRIVKFLVEDCRMDSTTTMNGGGTAVTLAYQNKLMDVVQYLFQHFMQHGINGIDLSGM